MNTPVSALACLLSGASMCFVATVHGHEPKVRPFQFQFERDGRLWFCTAKNKEVYAQLQANPAMEICAVTPEMTTVRVAGKAVLADDRQVKERILAEQEHIKKIYGTAENPVFTTLYVEHGSYCVLDVSGNPPRTGSF